MKITVDLSKAEIAALLRFLRRVSDADINGVFGVSDQGRTFAASDKLCLALVMALEK